MCDYKPSIVLWLRQTENAEQVRSVRKRIASLAGVLAVRSSVRGHHLVLIKYDEQQTSSQQILRVARSHNRSARLVGI